MRWRFRAACVRSGAKTRLDALRGKLVQCARLRHDAFAAASLGRAPEGKRFAFLKGNEKLLGSSRKFVPAGKNGMQLSELIPHHHKIADQVCWLNGMTTDVFNHGPAKLFLNTGFQAPGRPSIGAQMRICPFSACPLLSF